MTKLFPISIVLMLMLLPMNASAGYHVKSVEIIKGTNTGGDLGSFEYVDEDKYVISDEPVYSDWSSMYLGPQTTGGGDWLTYGCDSNKHQCVEDWPPDENTTYIYTSGKANWFETFTHQDINPPSVEIDEITMKVRALKTSEYGNMEYLFWIGFTEEEDTYLCGAFTWILSLEYTTHSQTINNSMISSYCSLNGDGIVWAQPPWTRARANTLYILHQAVVGNPPADNVRITTSVLFVHLRFVNYISQFIIISQRFTYRHPNTLYYLCENLYPEITYNLYLWRNETWELYDENACKWELATVNLTSYDFPTIKAYFTPDTYHYPPDNVSFDLFVYEIVTEEGEKEPVDTGGAWFIVWIALCTMVSLIPLSIYYWKRKRAIKE